MDLRDKKKITDLFKKNYNNKSFITAEISANHGGKLSNIEKIIKNLKNSEVDAIKIQLYKADRITINSDKKDFVISSKNTWKKYKSLYNLYKQAQTPYSWYDKINSLCKKNNLILFSSVFDLETVNFLKKKNCPIYKIASPEITDIPLIAKVAKTGKPVFLSTGLANKKDITLALKTLRDNRCKKIILMKCTSAYPAPENEINLKTMIDFKKKFKVQIGYSDHTIGNISAIAAATLGARVIEKHIIFNKKKKTVDDFFSTTLNDFKNMANEIRKAERVLGQVNYKISKESKKNLDGRKSIYAIKNIKKNEFFSDLNIRCIRPSFGLHPKYYLKLIGKKTKKKFSRGDKIKL